MQNVGFVTIVEIQCYCNHIGETNGRRREKGEAGGGMEEVEVGTVS